MDYSALPNLVHLNPAVPSLRALRIANPHGYRVTALTGEVWLTQHRRFEDVILRSGESYEIEGPGLALVTAFESSDIEVIPPARTQGPPTVDAAHYEQKARQLRAEAIDALITGAARRLSNRLSVLFRGLRGREVAVH
jgi:hypothetical protein